MASLTRRLPVRRRDLRAVPAPTTPPRRPWGSLLCGNRFLPPMKVPLRPGMWDDMAWPGKPGAASDCSRVDDPEEPERGREREKDVGDAAAEAQCEPAAASSHDKPSHVRKPWPQQPSGPLRRKIKPHAEAEHAVERANAVEIARSGVQHGRIAVEQGQPGQGEHGCAQSDKLAKPCRNAGADPGCP